MKFGRLTRCMHYINGLVNSGQNYTRKTNGTTMCGRRYWPKAREGKEIEEIEPQTWELSHRGSWTVIERHLILVVFSWSRTLRFVVLWTNAHSIKEMTQHVANTTEPRPMNILETWILTTRRSIEFSLSEWRRGISEQRIHEISRNLKVQMQRIH
jgi:hypothetical protein